MFKTLICDTNVFYDFGEGNKSLKDVATDGDYLYYSPITVVEIAANITEEKFPRCKAAARAIIESRAKQLPDPPSHLTRLFGYEPKDVPLDWSDVVELIAKTPNIDLLNGVISEVANWRDETYGWWREDVPLTVENRQAIPGRIITRSCGFRQGPLQEQDSPTL